VASFASVFIWFGADIAAEHLYSHPLIPIWNSLIRLSFFLIITFLLSSIRNLTEHERELSRTDSLTGAANSRLFAELAQIEINRLQRYKHPFFFFFIDIDNFKSMNDQFGHSVGDDILRTVVISARKDLRKTDVVARLGGDEFALLLSETNQEVASVMVSRVQDNLLKTMRNNNWSITFSIGVLTCSSAPNTTDELVRMADELMYSVKLGGKNAIKFYTYSG
jgi:diguanylate cyclase (GGDEF)-like protein